MPLARRALGKSGLSVSALGLGCMGMSECYGPADEAEALSTIHRAIDLGIDFLDTADSYGIDGANERLVGKAVRKRRDAVRIATKFGIVRDEKGLFAGVNGRPDHVRQACDASLKRLGLDAIDLYYLHRRDPDVPIEDTVGEMAELIGRGKVRYLGLSEVSAATLKQAAAIHPIAALQSEYSLLSRDVEDELLPACRELGVGFVAYSPLGRGLLGGKIAKLDALAPDDWRRHSPRFEEANFDLNRALVKRLEDEARARSCRPGQLALAWVLSRDPDLVALFGSKSRRYLEEDVEAAELSLTTEELQRLSDMIPRESVAGARYTEGSMRWIGT
jgi:aryl-alcohol dehydrogenase-like predicted oxidoreductase